MYLNNTLPNPQSQIENLLSLENKIREFCSRGDDRLLRQRFINYVLKLDNSYSMVTFSQLKLAKKWGCARETLVRLSNELHELGIVKKFWSGVKKTCLYEVNEYFHHFSFRKIMLDLFSSLKWFHKSMLYTPKPKSYPQRCHTNNTMYYKKVIKNKDSVQEVKKNYKKEGNFEIGSGKVYPKVKEAKDIAQEAKDTAYIGVEMKLKAEADALKREEDRKCWREEVSKGDAHFKAIRSKKLQQAAANNPNALFSQFANILNGTNPFSDI